MLLETADATADTARLVTLCARAFGTEPLPGVVTYISRGTDADAHGVLAGTHFCMGSALARLEGRIALEEILKRFPEWEADVSNARLSPTSTVRGWESMPATF